jgi:hypothetical protein
VAESVLPSLSNKRLTKSGASHSLLHSKFNRKSLGGNEIFATVPRQEFLRAEKDTLMRALPNLRESTGVKLS